MTAYVHLPGGYRHIAMSQVGSTNEVALAYGKNSDPGKLWISAESQITGKASRGRSWVSEPGNMYASLLLCPHGPVHGLARLTFVASLAVYDSLSAFVDEKSLALKWPNDVLWNGAKISGILLECHPLKDLKTAIVIGIGINCKSHPDNARHRATNLNDSGYEVPAERLFQQLAVEMDKWLQFWDNGDGFEFVRSQWLKRAVGIGSKVEVILTNRVLSGTFEQVDKSGCMILRTSDGSRQAISTADIFIVE